MTSQSMVEPSAWTSYRKRVRSAHQVVGRRCLDLFGRKRVRHPVVSGDLTPRT